MSKGLVEALKQILGWRELRSGNEFPIERIEEIARDAIEKAALSQQDAVPALIMTTDLVGMATKEYFGTLQRGDKLYTAPPSTAQEDQHEWVDHGERCAKCGDKDWFAGPKCEGRINPSQPTAQGAVCDCNDESQCWEPCGELGRSEEHAKVSDVGLPELPRKAQGVVRACTECGDDREDIALHCVACLNKDGWYLLSEKEESLMKDALVKTGRFVDDKAAQGVEEFNGWYCAHCQRGVDATEVTFSEQHEVCGRVITDDKPPPLEYGIVRVPVEPTEAMIEAGCGQHECRQQDPWYSNTELSESDCKAVYKSMLQAASKGE